MKKPARSIKSTKTSLSSHQLSAIRGGALPGVEGESSDAKHEDEVDVLPGGCETVDLIWIQLPSC